MPHPLTVIAALALHAAPGPQLSALVSSTVSVPYVKVLFGPYVSVTTAFPGWNVTERAGCSQTIAAAVNVPQRLAPTQALDAIDRRWPGVPPE